MNKYRNNGLDNVSAGRFIERGYTGPDMSKIRSLSNAIAGERTGNDLLAIKNITSDHIITPEEKVSLKEEWGFIEASYSSMKVAAEKLQVLDSEEFLEYQRAYEQLKALITPIFDDMDSSSNIDTSFDLALTKFYDSSNKCNIYITLLRNDILQQMYGVSLVVTSEVMYEPGTSKPQQVQFNAHIYTYAKGGKLRPLDEDIKKLYRDPDGKYSSLYKWKFTGVTNPDVLAQQFLGLDKAVVNVDSTVKQVGASFECEMVVG